MKLFVKLWALCLAIYVGNGHGYQPNPRLQETSNSTSKESVTQYEIYVNEEQPKLANVRLKCRLSSTRLYMAPGANQLPKGWATFIHNLEVKDINGEKVGYSQMQDNSWELACQENDIVIISYEFHLDHEEYEWSGGLDGVAYTTDWGNFYTGRALFIFNGEEEEDFRVTFNIPNKWKITTPWNKLEGRNQYKVRNTTSLRDAMFFIGEHEELKMKRDGFELIFVLGGEEVIGEKDTYKQLASGVLDYYTKLMGGLPKPPPGSELDKSVVIVNESTQTDGEVIGNNISILIERGGGQMAKMMSTFIFAHEFFHLWNGKSIIPSDDRTEWFKEGFTNFYTLKALRQVGFLDDQAFLSALNDIFYQRYRGDDGVGRISMTDGAQKHAHWGLIYGGGLFIAIAQDVIIRQNSRNKKSLDDFMRGLYASYAGTNETYNIDTIETQLSKLSNKNQRSFFEKYILGSEEIPLERYLSMYALEAKVEDEKLIAKKKGSQNKLEQEMTDGFFGQIKK